MTRNEKSIIFIYTLYSFQAAVSAVFVSMYLYRFLSGIAELTVLNIFQFILMPLGFFIGGQGARRIGKKLVLIAGLILFVLFYGLLVILRERSASYLYILGGINGLANGFFWYSFNLFIAESNPQEGKGTFFGIFGALGAIAGAVAPAVSTAILGFFPKVERGYLFLFVLIIGLSLITALAALGMNSRESAERFTVRDKLIPGRDPSWHFALGVNLVYGLRDGASWSIFSVLVLKAAGGDVLAGKLSIVFAVVGAAANIGGGKIFSERRSVPLWGWGSLGALLSSIILVTAVNPLGAAVSGILWKIAEAAVTLSFTVAYFNILTAYVRREGNVAGRNIAVELVLNVGRTLGAVAFLGFSFVTPYYAEILFPLLTLAIPVSFLLYRRYSRLRGQRNF